MRLRSQLAATVVVTLSLLGGCGTGSAPPNDAAPATGLQLDDRSVEAGAVTVTVTPRRLDDDGAIIEIELDTHSVELNVDLVQATVLKVDGVVWPVVEWSGDGAGGHHRSGELRFSPNGPARGLARLTIVGFDNPVEVNWDLGTS